MEPPTIGGSTGQHRPEPGDRPARSSSVSPSANAHGVGHESTVQGVAHRTEQLRARMDVLLRSRELALLVMAVLLFVVFAVLGGENFRDAENLLGAARQTIIVVIIAVGMTYLLIAGEIDLSVGANFALATILLAMMIDYFGWNPFMAAGAALAAGALVGLVNGIGVILTRMPSLIFTLAMMFMLKSIALLLTGGFPINFQEQSWFTKVTGGYIGPISVHLLWGALIVAVGAWILAKSRFGYHVYATGGNVLAAKRAGINTNQVKIICFVLSGVLSSFAGVLLIGLIQSGNPNTGTGYELAVIAAVVIGGTNLFGGAGSVVGTAIGAAILTLIANGLIHLGVSLFAEHLVTGLIIITAVVVDIQLRKRIVQ